MKKNRQEAILSLIESENVSTQEELMRALNALGYSVTQATVSRDIKALKLVKVPLSQGKYRYAPAKSETHEASDKFHAILKNSGRSVDFAGNMVVVKCFSGMANAACAAVDALIEERIVGTLAGDDTFFVLCRDETAAQTIAALLRTYIES
ncbi:MAG: arginine repressor [Clostridia bacterium]|nr:arginine repressor [Clostridia bacterium]